MAVDIADRNLLLCTLALQMEFLDRDQIVTGLNAWGQAKDKALTQVFVAQGSLSSDREQLLNFLVVEHLKQHNDNATKCLESLPAARDLRRDLGRLFDADVQASLRRIAEPIPEAPAADPFVTNYGPVGGTTKPEPVAPADPYATNLGSQLAGKTKHDVKPGGAAPGPSRAEAAPMGASRFRVLRPFARGGLGEVLVARDEEVQRDVALKQIQPHHADDPESRSRFLLEAEITGALEHPGIVPVYGLGQYADGRPYYAMRFIRGDSLKEAIDHFHQADTPTRDPGQRNFDLHKLLGRFIDVCQAVAYAHSRGVLHRDLKPGNIMLGKYGETLVVDWGLAKPMDRPDLPTEGAEQRPVTLSGTASATPTLMGAAVGTPQFMSPEQAAGQLDKLGPASDVYSLGATLFALLTGQVPLQDRDLITLLKKVQTGDIPRPRFIQPNIPLPLEAICMKAMALKQEDRYASPRDLADDIEHWLADEPVSAWPEPWTVKAGRWLRRHRTAATSVAAGVIVAVIGLVVINVLLNAAKERETAAKLQALKNYQLARASVDRYHTEVSENVLLNEPGMQPLRKNLLAAAQEFYAKFVAEHADDATVKGELGRAYFRLAQITGDIESQAKAIELHEKAEKILLAENEDYRADLARVQHHLGRLLRVTDQLPKSEEHYQKALKLWAPMAATQASLQAEQARSQLGLGNLYQVQRRLDLAVEEYRKALASWSALVEKHADVPAHLRDLATTHNNLGMAYAAQEGKKDAEAIEQFNRAITVLDKLAKTHPNVSKFHDDLARSHVNIGDLHLNTHQVKNALTNYTEAVRIWQELTKTHPAVLIFHSRLAEAYSALANAQRIDNQMNLAIAAATKAVEVQATLAAKDAAPNFRRELARRHIQLADLQRLGAFLTPAEKSYQAGFDLQQQLAKSLPDVPQYQVDMARTHNGLGLLRLEQKQHDRAEASFGKALEIWENLQKQPAQSAEFATGIAETFINLRNLTRTPGNYQLALEPLDRVIGVYASVALNLKAPAMRNALLQAHWTRAEARSSRGLHTEALQDWDQAKTLAVSDFEKSWVNLNRTVSLARYGEPDAAVKEAEALVEKADKLAPEAMEQLARVYALAGAAIAKKTDLDPAQAKKRIEQYAEQAVKYLDQARESGYFAKSERRQRLTSDPDWSSLRELPSFRTLVENITAPKSGS